VTRCCSASRRSTSARAVCTSSVPLGGGESDFLAERKALARKPENVANSEEVEHTAAAAEVGPLRLCRSEPVAEVDQEDERQSDVDVDDEQPGLRLPREHGDEDEIDDREQRDREDEELVGGALEVAALDLSRP
jgi:hypothetical protein